MAVLILFIGRSKIGHLFAEHFKCPLSKNGDGLRNRRRNTSPPRDFFHDGRETCYEFRNMLYVHVGCQKVQNAYLIARGPHGMTDDA